VSGIPSLAENTPNVSPDTSETLFTVLTAINTCGYDQELSASDPLRAQIGRKSPKPSRTPPARRMRWLRCASSTEAPARLTLRATSLNTYRSALYLQDPPTFTPKVKQAELRRKHQHCGFVPLMQAFYDKRDCTPFGSGIVPATRN
jgi:hypothetical protein